MLRSLLIAFCLVVTTCVARAEVFIENLTWVELRDAISHGQTTVLVPIGGTEQNGPHMTLGKHNARVTFLAERIALKLGNGMVAPTLAYVPEGNIDPPSGHMAFPGTISISDNAFRDVLTGTAESLRHAGFTTIVFLGDHGGYQKAMTAVGRQLDAKWNGKGRVFACLEYYRLVQEDYVTALKAGGFSSDEIGTHAALADTALELATAPEMVRNDRLQDASGSGIIGGSPARATAELGQKGVDLVVAGTVTAIQNFVGNK